MLPCAIRRRIASGRHVDELELVGAAHDVVGHGLALRGTGDAQDDVVERLEVLDVQRRDHVDAGIEQLLDVLPTLLVLRAGGVGVRVLVDQHDLRAAGQDRRRGPSRAARLPRYSISLSGMTSRSRELPGGLLRGRASRRCRRRRRCRVLAANRLRPASCTSCRRPARRRGRCAVRRGLPRLQSLAIRGLDHHGVAGRRAPGSARRTLTPGSPSTPSSRPSVYFVDERVDDRRDRARVSSATRATCSRALAIEMCGSRPGAGRGDRVDRAPARRRPARSRSR